MPYFAWEGVNLKAQWCKGKHFAPTQLALDALLFKKEIALIRCKEKRFLFTKGISSALKIDYFTQLSWLLSSGMRLPQALQLIAEQTSNVKLAQIAFTIAQKVHHGVPLAQALDHAQIFDSVIIQMSAVGQESGNLSHALEVLVSYLQSIAQFKKQLKSVLIAPLITLSFFLCIALFALLVIIPQFAHFFSSLQRDVPSSTQRLLTISTLITQHWIGILFVLFLAITGSYYAFQHRDIKEYFKRVILQLPGIGTIILNSMVGHFFKSMALLLNSGISLRAALGIAKETIPYKPIKQKLVIVDQHVQAGNTFDQSLAHIDIFAPEIIALIKVAQESSQMGNVLNKVAERYQNHVLRSLNKITTLFQPLLLLILGLLITLFIIALYSPILTMSFVI